jgi:hypothetical protein
MAVVGFGGPAKRPELAMTVVRTVGEILSDHVTLEVESVDRLYLNVYQPGRST